MATDDLLERKDESTLRIWQDNVPAALSKEENLKLILEYQKTTDEGLRKKLRDKIVYGNMRLAISVLNDKYYIYNDWTREEFLQGAIFEIIEAIDEFDIQKGDSFSNFLYLKLYQSFGKTLKRMLTQNHGAKVVSFESGFEDGETFDKFIESEGHDEDWVVSKVDENFLLEKILPRFSDVKQFIFKEYFFENKTQSAIAKELGVSRQNVSNLLCQMQKDVRKIYLHGDKVKITNSYKNYKSTLHHPQLPPRATQKQQNSGGLSK